MRKLLVVLISIFLTSMSLTPVVTEANQTAVELYPLKKPNSNDWALSDITGKIHARFTLPEGASLMKFENGIGILRNSNSGKWGLIDGKGKIVVNYKYNYISSFSEGLAGFLKDGKHGFIDKNGNEVIKAQFDRVGDFRFGRAAASINKKWGMIDLKGAWIFPPQYDFISYSSRTQQYSNDPIPFKQGDYYGYISNSGKIVIPPKFVRASEFSEGLADVQEAGKQIGYIDWDGQYILPPKYYFATSFYDGIAYVSSWKPDGIQLGGALINKKGDWIVPPGDFTPFSGGSYSREGIISFGTHNSEDGRNYYGAVTTKGEIIIPAQYGWLSSFHNGIAMVRLHDGREGFIDTKGNYLVGPKYFGSYENEYGALSYRNGIYAVNWGRDGYLDYSGKLIIPPYR